MIKIIKILQSTPFHKKGEVCEVSESLGEELIEKGVAEMSNEEELKKQEDKWFSKKYKQGVEKANAKYEAEQDANNKRNLAMLRNHNLVDYIGNVERFYEIQPFFYDKNGLFWFWQHDKYCYQIVDEVDIMNSLDDSLCLGGVTVNNKLKGHYIEAFKRVGRKRHPKEAPSKWIQFRSRAYSITADEVYDVQPNYFFTNPIPHKIGDTVDTPVMDKLFEEWVGTQYMDTLYEIIAYCCYRDYPLHIIFCMVGSGRNGKSQFQRLVRRFLGDENVCDTELDDLMVSRFEQFGLYKKLMCSMGETNFGTMTRTSKLKKLSGQDLVTFERKGVQGFNDVNYAKLIINSNSLPSTRDTSDGFYRRWLIIKFPNEFPEGRDIINDIPEEEYDNLAKKVTLILPKLLERGKFLNQGSIEERKHNFILNSNPLSIFINAFCIRDEEAYVEYGELYTSYLILLKKLKMRKVTMKEFRSGLEDEGFWVEKTSKRIGGLDGEFKSSRWIEGIKIDSEALGQLRQNDRTTIPSLLYKLSNRNRLKKSLLSSKDLENIQKDISVSEESIL